MTTLMLATTGGHLDQLDDLASRVPVDDERLWVTHANEQSRSLLAGRDVEFVPYVRVRSVADVVRCVPTARRLLRERAITRVVSTGSGIALGYLPYLAARGVECHYIESAARVTAPSLTGRVLERTPRISRYTQYPALAGRRWHYTGSVFDSFLPTPSVRPGGEVIRVVVTVGTAAEFPFSRLIDALVPLLRPGGQLERETGQQVEVLWQTGCTPVDHHPITAHAYLGARELTAALGQADIVVSHAGTGSALGALDAGRRPLLATRTARLGEAGDDHQAELAAELTRRRLAAQVEPDRLTVHDLVESLGHGVRRCAVPPTFELRS